MVKMQKLGQPEVKKGPKITNAEATFAGRENFLHFFISLASYALLSFRFLIWNAEFDSNSSCLDRFNKFGINSLQKYKISHKMRSIDSRDLNVQIGLIQLISIQKVLKTYNK